MADKEKSGEGGKGGEAAGSTAAESLRPEAGLEMVRNREFLSENVSISGRHFERCSFNFCNSAGNVNCCATTQNNTAPITITSCANGFFRGKNNRLVCCSCCDEFSTAVN